MATLDPFGLQPGTESGRLQPSGWIAPEGDFAFVLGHDHAGVHRKFNIGDYVQIAQSVNFGLAKVLRMKARLRPPAEITVGAYWAFQILIDGVEKYRRTMRRSQQRDLNDIAINVAGYAGTHSLQLRLALFAS